MLFVATNIDDILILVAFLADPRIGTSQVVLGQLLGMAALVFVSILAALISLVIPSAYVGFLGLLPIALGVRELIEFGKDRDASEDDVAEFGGRGTRGAMIAVAAVTVANGGDNIAVYTPVFAVQTAAGTAGLVVVFVLMTLLWCGAAHWLVNHRTVGASIRRYGRRLLPFVLIALGILIMVGAGTVELIRAAISR